MASRISGASTTLDSGNQRPLDGSHQSPFSEAAQQGAALAISNGRESITLSSVGSSVGSPPLALPAPSGEGLFRTLTLTLAINLAITLTSTLTATWSLWSHARRAYERLYEQSVHWAS